MTPLHTPVSTLPPLVSAVLRPLPLPPLELFLKAVLRRIVRQHPRIFGRLGLHAGKRYGLAPCDVPFAFILDTTPQTPQIRAVRRLTASLDAKISGPLAALLGMADGSYDGDALFFSRTIVVEGDIEAVLALRNAVDDAGVDVLREAAALFGPLGQIGEVLFRHRRLMEERRRTAEHRQEPKGQSPWN